MTDEMRAAVRETAEETALRVVNPGLSRQAQRGSIYNAILGHIEPLSKQLATERAAREAEEANVRTLASKLVEMRKLCAEAADSLGPLTNYRHGTPMHKVSVELVARLEAAGGEER